MIHHISIPAENPLQVAQVLAELWHGRFAVFPGHPSSYLVLPLDQHGTMIEVFPWGTELLPGYHTAAVEYSYNFFASVFTATHAAISIPANEAEIAAIAEREDWRMIRCDRGGCFSVIELWVENHIMLELLTPSLTAQYLEFMQPENLQHLLTEPVVA